MPNSESEDATYKVTIRHNVVTGIERLERTQSDQIPRTKLEVGMQLAQNHQTQGCIDGEYFFADAARAKDFARLSLDFMNRLLEKSLEELESADAGTADGWSNPHSATPD